MNDPSELPSAGGYVYLAATGCPTLKIPVQSADMASAMFEQYRDRNGLGASDLKPQCGSIFAHDGTLVARVSYNGRVWSPDGTLLQEPSTSLSVITPSRPLRASELGSATRRLVTKRYLDR
jgi:hypothetical protein